MKLAELQAGAKIILKVSINNQNLEFPSIVTGINKDRVIAEAIRITGKVLGLSGNGIIVDMMLIRDNKPPFIWKNVKCNTGVFDNRTQYEIIAFAEGYEINRREAFRLFVGNMGIAQLGINRKAIDVIVKDISESGFSFVTDANLENVINMPVRLVFSDMNKQFSLMGIVVRKVVIEEKKILYGCTLSVKNAEIAKYINEKQRQLMSINKNNSAYKTKEKLMESLSEKGVTSDVLKEHQLKNNPNNNRAINDVGIQERRDVFKDTHVGKKV